MRVLMLSELYPPYIGGSEQHVRNLSRALVERGHEVSVATVGPGQPTTTDEDGMRVHRLRSAIQRASALLPSGRPYLPPFPDPAVAWALRAIVARERPELVHAHNWMVHSFLPLKRRSGAKLVLTLHDYGVMCAKRSLLYRDRECSGPALAKCLRCAAANYGAGRGTVITLANSTMRRPLLRAVDMFVPVSAAVARGNELERQRVPFEVIPNFAPDGVADATDARHPALAGLPDQPFWLYVGALSRHKGVPVLLEAYRQVADAPPLVLIGRPSADGPQIVPPDVVVLHDLPHAAVMAAWRRSSVGFVPSLFPDPCPTVAIEAMACGVPLIASHTGGLPDLVADGESGVLTAPGDVAALTGAMRRMLERPDQRAAMADAARRRAPEFMASAVVTRLEALYTRLLA